MVHNIHSPEDFEHHPELSPLPRVKKSEKHGPKPKTSQRYCDKCGFKMGPNHEDGMHHKLYTNKSRGGKR